MSPADQIISIIKQLRTMSAAVEGAPTPTKVRIGINYIMVLPAENRMVPIAEAQEDPDKIGEIMGLSIYLHPNPDVIAVA